jgi:hypothetical protein
MFKYSIGLLLIVLVMSSCRKEPQYGDAPEIEFKNIEKYSFINKSRVRTDSLVFVVGYKDGDGNLGLDVKEVHPEDSQPPFNFGSPYYNNFILRFYEGTKQPNGELKFEPYRGGFQLAERFQRISNDDKKEPLEGEIRYSYVFTEDLIDDNTVFKFDVQIFDRNTPVPNASNIATSEPVILFEKK